MGKSKNFNLPDLFQKAFGITPIKYEIPKGSTLLNTGIKVAEYAAGQAANEALSAPTNSVELYPSIKTNPASTKASIQSVLGTPIYEQIMLTIPIINSTGKQTGTYTYIFPDWPMFDITAAWLIKKENTQGGTGTVKEFIQQDDFAITIRGFLINYTNDDYPEQLLADFWKAVSCKKTIGITSAVFNLLGIHNIVIENVKLVGVEGYNNIQPFEIEAISDEPIELVIKSVKTQRAITPGQ